MKKILYLGDTHLQDAAAYLAGVMHHFGFAFDYLPSDAKPSPAQWNTNYGLIILSDYPAANLQESDHAAVLSQVENGTGLLMVGGWESYHGMGGDWDGTPIGDALPVEISLEDDRRNIDRAAVVHPVKDHAIIKNLPWAEGLPLIGGLNQVQPKPDAELVLEALVFNVQIPEKENYIFQFTEMLPLLVAGQHGQGRTVSLLTDVAPHWVGPLVDWGQPRITAQAPKSNPIEVGGNYAKFLKQLLEWTMGES